MKIAVVGGGIAGSSAALFFNKKKHEVTLFEREEHPKPLGAGIMLQPSGKKTLIDLGVQHLIEKHTRPLYHFHGVNSRNEEIIHLNLNSLSKTSHGYGTQRGFLFHVLFNQLEKNGIDLIKGEEIVKIINEDTLLSSSGNKYNGYDLIVIANGSRSKIRDQFSICSRSKQQNISALWAKIPLVNPDLKDQIFQIYDDRKLIGFMPIGTDPFLKDDTELVNFFYGLNQKHTSILKGSNFTKWKDKLINKFSFIEEQLSFIESPEQFTFAPYFDSRITPLYHKNIVFIGDVGHALSPQLSSGTNLALLDAKVLSECINENQSVKSGLKKFSNSRMQQLSYYYYMSKLVTPLFQSNLPINLLRDKALPLALKNKYFHELVIKTITGTKQGLFTNLASKYYQ